MYKWVQTIDPRIMFNFRWDMKMNFIYKKDSNANFTYINPLPHEVHLLVSVNLCNHPTVDHVYIGGWSGPYNMSWAKLRACLGTQWTPLSGEKIWQKLSPAYIRFSLDKGYDNFPCLMESLPIVGIAQLPKFGECPQIMAIIDFSAY